VTSGTVQATHFTTPSDIRLKTSFFDLYPYWNRAGTLGAATDASFYDLRPVSFQWKSTGQEDFGLIAQNTKALLDTYNFDDTQQVTPLTLPIVTSTYDGTREYLTIDYSKLSVLNLAMVRDLNQRVMGLEDGAGPGGAGTLGQRVTTLETQFASYQDTLVTVIGQTPPVIQPDSIWAAYVKLYKYVNSLADLIGTIPGYNPAQLPYGRLD
jgi:hypothetical protein